MQIVPPACVSGEGRGDGQGGGGGGLTDLAASHVERTERTKGTRVPPVGPRPCRPVGIRIVAQVAEQALELGRGRHGQLLLNHRDSLAPWSGRGILKISSGSGHQ